MASQHEMSCLEVWGGNHPVDATVSLPGLDAWVLSLPHQHAEEGGDVHYVSSCGTGRITRLLVADVAGHGMNVASIARQLRGLMRRYVNHISPLRFLRAMNRSFTRVKPDSGRFATAVVVTFFASDRSLSIALAGHPPPIIWKARDRTWRYHQPATDPASTDHVNLPLGVESRTGFSETRLTMDPGDRVLIYTDALIEARLRDKSFLGLAGLLEIVSSIPGEASGVISQLHAKLAVAGAKLDDDTTALLVEVTGKGRAAPLHKRLVGMLKMIPMLLGPNAPWPEMSRENLGLGGRRKRPAASAQHREA